MTPVVMFVMCAVLGGGAFGSEANAQSIAYSYDGGTPVAVASGQDFTVNVGTVTGVKVLHIYDPSFATLPDDDAGKVTITGSLGTNGQLRVIVAGASQGWLTSNTDPILQVGLRHLGVDASDGMIVTDADLRANTRLMAYVSGDVRGDITLGQVRRIQAGNLDPNSPTGIISANLTSTGANVPAGDGPLEGAIGYIIAGDAITGTVTATTPPAGSADIERVQVGPNTAAAGISGDIIAESGAIRAIYTTGPIDSGTPTRLRLNAANQIGQIRTIDGSATLLARDVNADIVANQSMADDPDNYLYLSPQADGSLSFMEVGGDLHGSVRVGNLTPNSLLPGASRSGIFINGICYAPIDVDIAVVQSNIVARTFTGPITIGYSLTGTVVATGGATEPDPMPTGYEDGRIPEISVGRGEVAASAVSAYSTVDGLGGALYSRTIPTSPSEWFLVGTSGTPAVIDSAIHAEQSIGTADVRAMQNGANACVKFAPAIEAPRIESLTIDAYAMGAVWSGQIDENDPDALYATIDSLRVGCMRQEAALWITGWTSAVIETDMFGDIHVPRMDAGQTIQIGRIFGDEGAAELNDEPVPEACECSTQGTQDCQVCDWHWNYLDQVVGLQLPRNPWWPKCNSAANRAGQVIVREDQALAGQVIVNATATTLSAPALWSGQAHIGTLTADCPTLELSTAQSQPDLAPHYARLSADLGGGAVGLVPFALHLQDCDPPADAAQASRTFLNSEFCHIPYARNLCEGSDPGEIYSDASIYLQFYGPILAESVSERPYEIGIEVNGQPDFSTDYGMWTQYEILPQLVGGAERRLRISGGEFTQLLAGHYYIRPKRTGSARLLCDGLLPGAAATAVAEFTYDFWLVRDCNTNGVDDELEQTGFCCLNLCDPDYNQDGNADQDDVAYLTNVVAGGYNPTGRDPDCDGDGNVNQDDVQALVNTIGGGGCP